MSRRELAVTTETEVAEVVDGGLAHKEMRPGMKKAVDKISKILEKAQEDNLCAFWNIGRLIVEVRDNPEEHLTDEQIASHVDGEAVILSIFAPVYTAEQLRGAVNIFEAYPSESELERLLALRCPSRPRWRITATHAQLLAQIPDDSQRAAVEERCVEEAYNARTLSVELRELRGRKRSAGAGRPHEAPKGLKNQLEDLRQLQRRFIHRSENLWLNEESDNIYDELANTPPSKLTETLRGYFEEIQKNFDRLDELVADHRAMCRKFRETVLDKLEAADESDDESDAEEVETFSKASRMTKNSR